MKLTLNYENNTNTKLIGYQKRFRMIAKKALELNNLTKNYDVSVTIVDDETIHQMNKEYRHIDRPTDVLSFAFNDYDEGIIDEPINELGDIIISIDTCKRQAKEYGHSFEREMCFLFTHGFLHLLGYDHMEKEDEVEMFKMQDIILNELEILR